MDPIRPIDEASTPEEVIQHVLTMPISEADEMRALLWEFKSGILSEIQGRTRIQILESRKTSDYWAGPYGLIGPYGIVSFLLALVAVFFVPNGGLFVGVFCLTFAFCTLGFLRTTPRWTVAQITDYAARPANTALFFVWARTQGYEVNVVREVAAGLADTTDYYVDLVAAAFEQDEKFALKVCDRLLGDQPELYPWLWRFSPTEKMFDVLEKRTLDETHIVGLVGLITTLQLSDRPSTNAVVTEAFALAYQPKEEIEHEDLKPYLTEELLDQLPPAETDLDRLAVNTHPIAFHVLDAWRRTVDVDALWKADRLLRATLQRHTGVHVKPGVPIETALDSVLFPLVEDPTYGDLVRDGIFERRERDMVTQRRIEPDVFESFFCHQVHTQILWGVYWGYDLRGTFRVDETYNLVQHDDRPFMWEPNNMVGVVHPAELSRQTLEKWQLAFADYDLHGFNQLSRPTYEPPPGNIAYFDGTPDLTMLGRLGWSNSLGENDEFARRLERVFEWGGKTEKGVIEIAGDETSLAFWSFAGPMSVRLKRPLKDVNSIVLSEALYSLNLAMAE